MHVNVYLQIKMFKTTLLGLLTHISFNIIYGKTHVLVEYTQGAYTYFFK
jgi:hypothetical protein